jgi:hypothetical protein
MKCTSVKPYLPLYLSDDLTEGQLKRIARHLSSCSDCTRELESLRQAQSAVEQIAAADQPEPLPEDFSLSVHRRIVADSASAPSPSEPGTLWRRLPKFAPVAAVVGLIAVLLVTLTQVDRIGNRAPREPVDSALTETSVVDLSELVERYGDAVVGPIPVTEWEPSGEAGVYAVLHKSDPEADSAAYAVDYCGQSDRLQSYRGSPWIRQKQGRLIARAGSPDNIYIIIIVLPESSNAERRHIERALRDEYKPFFNRRNGV